MKTQTPTHSCRLSFSVRSLAIVAGLMLFAQMAVAAPLTLPFDGDPVPGGIRVRDTKTPYVRNGDIVSFVATANKNHLKHVSNMATFETSANIRKDHWQRVAVYNQTNASWAIVRLVNKTNLLDKLGTFVVTPTGLMVQTPKHSELKAGDIIDFVSIPDNPGLIFGTGKTDVSTKADLKAALRNQANANGRVAIHYMRKNTLGGFVHINVN